MFEYYVYSISHGQESACGGRARPHRLAVSVLNNDVRMTRATSHMLQLRERERELTIKVLLATATPHATSDARGSAPSYYVLVL